MIPAKMNTSLVTIALICMYVFGPVPDQNTTREAPDIYLTGPEYPVVTHNTTVSGELSGFDCAVVGVLCPTTHRGADYTTGVFTDDEKFYFIVNIPQSFLQQYFRQTVEVEGTAYDPYAHAVEPETIHLIEEDERRLVYDSGYFIDEEGRRSTFQDGVFRDGQWNVR